MADARFSVLAALACLIVTVLSAVRGAWAPSVVFALLTAGFLARGADSYRRR
ncbi:MAG TPA: hypothetical protein VKG62_04610 [Solirubrobacteraceae bacterium]|nr:hypothetical protein [Solirubrobacteraceae bacterium]